MEEKSGKFYVRKNENNNIQCPVNIILIEKLRNAYFREFYNKQKSVFKMNFEIIYNYQRVTKIFYFILIIDNKIIILIKYYYYQI